jgi:hypothetical protein
MIKEIDYPLEGEVFYELDSHVLCLAEGMLNPLCSDAKFRSRGWYPFQDFYFDERIISRMLWWQAGKPLYRQSMPCRGSQIRYYEISDPTGIDVRTILEWLNYDEGIIWSSSGTLIINSYSDLAVLSMSDRLSEHMFGATVRSLYNNSVSIFTEKSRPAHVNEYLALIMTTWESGETENT